MSAHVVQLARACPLMQEWLFPFQHLIVILHWSVVFSQIQAQLYFSPQIV